MTAETILQSLLSGLLTGAQATYPVDFSHLCDYLAAAAVVAAPEPAAWVTEKKTWLKANRWSDVLDTLARRWNRTTSPTRPRPAGRVV